jgi:hypothetical protein
MSTVAAQALPVLALLAPACTPPTFLRLPPPAVAAVLTTGRRTVAHLLRPSARRTGGPQGGSEAGRPVRKMGRVGRTTP